MTGFDNAPKLLYTKQMFAFDPATFKVNTSNPKLLTATVDAYGITRRKATKKRAVGYTALTWYGIPGPHVTYQDFLDNFSLRYNYNRNNVVTFPFMWDGTELWGTTDFWYMTELVKKMDPLLKSEPTIPSNLDGWYIMK